MNQAQKDSHIEIIRSLQYWGDSSIDKGDRGGWG